MVIIEQENVIYNLSKDNKPASFCKAGDTVLFKTLDCFSNKLLPFGTRLGIDNPKQSNPLSGPLYIEDAKPGDTLSIEIIDIEVGEVGIAGSGKTILLPNLSEYKIQRVTIQNGIANLMDGLSLPIRPMIGTIGVAPCGHAVVATLPGVYGGNMDCKKIRKGSIIYLPVYCDGALMAIGDIHALMGDGEISECGLEIEGIVTVKVNLIKNTKRNSPAVLADNQWITIATAVNLDKAAAIVTADMNSLLVDDLGFDEYDAGMLLSICGNICVCSINELYSTVRLEFPFSVLEKFNFIPR